MIKQSSIRVAFLCFLAAFYLGAGYAVLWLADELLASKFQKQADFVTRAGINKLDLYPYTGFHVQPNYHHRGDLSEKQPYHDYDIQSGDLGFFDFSLTKPYPKQPGEFRIILIGGSGAQGWGAQSNAHMIYRLLPAYLNEALKQCDIHVTVFNLAMSGSVTYQNFIALNLWGHRLKPDMILSYSGRNEVNVPFTVGSDAYFMFPELDALVLKSRMPNNEAVPAWLKRNFPHLMEQTHLGDLFNRENSYYVNIARTLYGDTTGTFRDRRAPKVFFTQVIKPAYLNALQSIKRDFNGIPIVLAWQAVNDKEWPETGLPEELGGDFYDKWFQDVKAQLHHYVNDQWVFIDANNYMRDFPDANTGTHEGNAGQDILSRYLANQLAVPITKWHNDTCHIQHIADRAL